MQRILPRACVPFAAALTLLLPACGKTNSKGNDVQVSKDNLVQPAEATGCIQGLVINGLTGDRVDLPAADQSTGAGIMVRVRDQLIGGASMAVKHDKNPLMKGEYSLCNVPLEDDFPLYVNVDGYQPFAATIHIASSIAERSAKANADIQKPLPTSVYNIRIYPVGTETQDLKVHVLYAATPVKGATVQLIPSDKNYLDRGAFLAPSNGALLTQSATTDDSGVATFSAAKLALGGVYDYVVIPPAGTARTATRVAGGLTVGLLAARGDHDAYTLDINLDDTSPTLKVVSESREPNTAGSKTCVFNRPVALVSGSSDGIFAHLTGAVSASLMPNVPGNDASETVSVALAADGYSITLTPVWNKSADLTKEPGISVSYTGIQLQPAAEPNLGERLMLADHCQLTVSLAR